MGGQQRITGHVRAHLAVPQDEVGQDGEHRTTRGALEPPDGEPTQADTGVMGVPRQAPAAATARLVGELKAQGEKKSEDTLNKRFAIVKQTKVGGLVLEIDGDSAIVSYPFAHLCHVSPMLLGFSVAEQTPWGSRLEISRCVVQDVGVTT